MNNNSEHRQNALAVASGIHVAEYDKMIGTCVLLGILFFPLVPASAFVGLPVLGLLVWARHDELNK